MAFRMVVPYTFHERMGPVKNLIALAILAAVLCMTAVVGCGGSDTKGKGTGATSGDTTKKGS
jgi:hypothetical protein